MLKPLHGPSMGNKNNKTSVKTAYLLSLHNIKMVLMASQQSAPTIPCGSEYIELFLSTQPLVHQRNKMRDG